MDPCFLAEDDSDAEGEGHDEIDDAASEASSAFISNPDEDEETSEPYARPSNPEPSDDDKLYSNYESNPVFSDDEDEDAHPLVRLPSRSSLAPPMPADEEEENAHDEQDLQQALEEEDYLPCPTSPYRIRASPDSWTGLGQTRWGRDFYLASDNATMGVLSAWEAASGVYHGRLMRCTWGGYTDRDRVPLPAAGVELKLTTPEGLDVWLDDCFTVYAPGSDVFDFTAEKRYGHVCGEECAEYLDRFGWEDFRSGDGIAYVEEQELRLEQQGEDDEFGGLEGPEYMDQQVAKYSRALLAAIPEEQDKICQTLETIAEEDEEEGLEEDDEDGESVLGLVDMALLGRIAAAVDMAPDGAEEELKPKEERLWMRDPTYVSGMRWSDMLDEEDEY